MIGTLIILLLYKLRKYDEYDNKYRQGYKNPSYSLLFLPLASVGGHGPRSPRSPPLLKLLLPKWYVPHLEHGAHKGKSPQTKRDVDSATHITKHTLLERE